MIYASILSGEFITLFPFCLIMVFEKIRSSQKLSNRRKIIEKRGMIFSKQRQRPSILITLIISLVTYLTKNEPRAIILFLFNFFILAS